jgi:hypothetical protein
MQPPLTNIEVLQLVAVDPTMNAAFTHEADAELGRQQMTWGAD